MKNCLTVLPVPLRYSCRPQMMLCPPDAWRPAKSTATRTAGLGSEPLALPLMLPLPSPRSPFTEFAAGGEVLVVNCRDDKTRCDGMAHGEDV